MEGKESTEETGLSPYRGQEHEGWVAGRVGWVHRPIVCMFHGMDELTGPCDTLPEFVMINNYAALDPNARYCYRHVRYAAQIAALNQATGNTGGFSPAAYHFSPRGSSLPPGVQEIDPYTSR